MPTFTAIALDRLLEPGASRSAEKSVPSGKHLNSRPPIAKLEKQGTKPAKVTRPPISPALYATPEAIPLPDSPSSFPPSPYIINHKGRGPRLMKSFSYAEVSSQRKTLNEGNAKELAETDKVKATNIKRSTSLTFSTPEEPIEEGHGNSAFGSPTQKSHLSCAPVDPLQRPHNGFHVEVKSEQAEQDLGSCNEVVGEVGQNNLGNGSERESIMFKSVEVNAERDFDSEDFYDPNESMSLTSNAELEDAAGAEGSKTLLASGGEFYDAWEELSSDGGMQLTPHDTEGELRGIRLSLLTEIEKKKQAEEALYQMQTHWQKVREQLVQVGVMLPADPTNLQDGEQLSTNLAEELGLQLDIARFVSASVGRGSSKAQLTMEMEALVELKNFEISRLSDRLHYYEAVNREMCQRNQEAVEMARRDRHRRKKIQKWVWGSIVLAISLGSAGLAWSYLPSGRDSYSREDSQAPESGDVCRGR